MAAFCSTLDSKLRGEEGGFGIQGALLLASAAAYLFLPPGEWSMQSLC